MRGIAQKRIRYRNKCTERTKMTAGFVSRIAEVAAYNLGSCQRSADTSLFQCELRQFGAALRPACVCCGHLNWNATMILCLSAAADFDSHIFFLQRPSSFSAPERRMSDGALFFQCNRNAGNLLEFLITEEAIFFASMSDKINCISR